MSSTSRQEVSESSNSTQRSRSLSLPRDFTQTVEDNNRIRRRSSGHNIGENDSRDSSQSRSSTPTDCRPESDHDHSSASSETNGQYDYHITTMGDSTHYEQGESSGMAANRPGSEWGSLFEDLPNARVEVQSDDDVHSSSSAERQFRDRVSRFETCERYYERRAREYAELLSDRDNIEARIRYLTVGNPEARDLWLRAAESYYSNEPSRLNHMKSYLHEWRNRLDAERAEREQDTSSSDDASSSGSESSEGSSSSGSESDHEE